MDEQKLETLLLQEAQQLVKNGQSSNAEALARILLEHNPNNLQAAQLLINILSSQKNYEEISTLLFQLHNTYPNNHEITHNLSIALQKINNLKGALLFASKTLMLVADTKQYTAQYAELYNDIYFKYYYEPAAEVLLACFNDPNISHQKLYKPWSSLLEKAEPLESFWAIDQFSSYDEYRKNHDLSALKDALSHPLFLTGIKLMIYPNPKFERIMTFIRRRLLTEYDKEFLDLIKPFLSSLGQHCFYNEYIFETSEQELTKLSSLDLTNETDILLYACFKPLYGSAIDQSFCSSYETLESLPLKEVIKLQLINPNTEEELKETIPLLTPIEDKISHKVKAQYEVHPYPRWLFMDKLSLSDNQKQASKDKTILVAGCGTGKEAIINSMLFPYAQITAIDISMTSLAYAKRKANELGITNINFKQADILKLNEIEQKFDFITSSGVIHHMDSPQKGLDALKGQLKKGGVIKIGLYSERGRSTIVKCHKAIKDMGLSNSVEDIQKFRRYIFSGEASEELTDITKWTSFFSFSECRDLLFHVKEHRFTPLTLSDLLDKSSMRFLGFKLRDPETRRKYISSYPDDKKGTNFTHWEEFEQKYPDTFSLMYFCWCVKSQDYKKAEFPEWLKQAMGPWLY